MRAPEESRAGTEMAGLPRIGVRGPSGVKSFMRGMYVLQTERVVWTTEGKVGFHHCRGRDPREGRQQGFI